MTMSVLQKYVFISDFSICFWQYDIFFVFQWNLWWNICFNFGLHDIFAQHHSRSKEIWSKKPPSPITFANNTINQCSSACHIYLYPTQVIVYTYHYKLSDSLTDTLETWLICLWLMRKATQCPRYSYMNNVGKPPMMTEVRLKFLIWSLVKILRVRFGWDFEPNFCSRLWRLSLVEILKHNFGQYFEAEAWSILKLDQ